MKYLLLPILLIACGDKDADSGTTEADDSGTTDTPPVELNDFSQPGPYAAGTLSTEITGSTGVSLTVQVWYPADEAGSETVTYDGLLEGSATTDAIPSCAVTHPVVVFSHGYGGIRWQSPFLVEHLATHGYMVIAPDHTYNTFLDNDDSLFAELIIRRPQDLIDSFDWLVAQGDDDASTLTGCLDEADGYAVSGHSFGGYTAYATGGATINSPGGGTADLSDDRVWAIFPLAPWDAEYTLTDGTADITVPVMCLSGTRDTTTTWSSVTAMYDGVTITPRYLGEFPDAGHYSFSPLACEFGTTGNGCGDDYIDIDTFTGLVNTAAMSFLEEARGTAGAIEQLPTESDALIWEIVE